MRKNIQELRKSLLVDEDEYEAFMVVDHTSVLTFTLVVQ